MPESNEQAGCACGNAPKLIFSCSGAADVGHVSDLAARKLNSEGAGKMFCLAGIGGRVSGIVETTRAARWTALGRRWKRLGLTSFNIFG